MAFNQINLKVDRSEYNNSALGKGPAFHQYSSVDTLATVFTSGYFPPWFGYDHNTVSINDILTVYDTTDLTSQIYLISSVNPMVLIPVGADESEFSQSFSIQSGSGVANFLLPITFSRDANGIVSVFLTNSIAFTTIGSGAISFASFVLPTIFLPEATAQLPIASTASPVIASDGFVTLMLTITTGGSMNLTLAPGVAIPSGNTITMYPSTSNYFG
jgi:hypothetical protein